MLALFETLEAQMNFAESYVLFSSCIALIFVAGSFLPTPVEDLFNSER